MEKLKAQSTLYEIEKTLGGGLTSEVYKAFRKDSKGYTRQPVALKIIKSRKDVHVLKQEYESLAKMRSRYCVGILAWENFPDGPALVLEYINGVTLAELRASQDLKPQLAREILCQAERGLKELHRQGLVHGDLNLRNIMIDRWGVVKLIDFGFGSEEFQMVTPEFASPERLAGSAPTSASDLFALEKLGQKLVDESFSLDQLTKQFPRAKQQRQLAQLVRVTQNQSREKTCRLLPNPRPARERCGTCRGFVATLIFPVLLFWPTSQPVKQAAHLQIRSQQWIRYSINGLPFRFGPLSSPSMRPGRYHIHWESPSGAGTRDVKLQAQKTFLLKPSGEPL